MGRNTHPKIRESQEVNMNLKNNKIKRFGRPRKLPVGRPRASNHKKFKSLYIPAKWHLPVHKAARRNDQTVGDFLVDYFKNDPRVMKVIKESK